VRRCGVRIQQGNSYRLRPALPHLVDHPRQVLEGLNLRPGGIDTAVDSEAELPRGKRDGPIGHRVVQRRPVLPPDLDHIRKPGRRYERSSGSFAFQQRVGRHRGSVEQTSG